jgi:protein tyrosine phosphatase (PTP) superfamily phosphohydrolase (DUF442 family)
MFRRISTSVSTTAIALLLSGCCSTWHRDTPCTAPCNGCAPCATLPPRVAPPPGGVIVPGAVAVPAGPAGPAGAVYQPPAVPATPPGAVYLPPAAPAVPTAPPTAVVQGSYNVPAVADAAPRVQEPTVRLAPPELSTPGPTQAPPQTKEPPAVAEPPSSTLKPEPAPSAPIDIPQFAVVRKDVATGLQPFPDGVAWLKKNGYRTVLHVGAPGTDDAAARRLFEKYGLRYVAIDVDPRSLNKEAVDYFNRLVGDQTNLPLFVYDKDGALTGGLWYLHFRLVEGWSDEKAREEAARLGFRQEQDDNHRTMWIAVQKLLEANGR